MAFGNIGTFYFPIAGSAGSSLWGTDVRKLLDSADGTADTTTICNHGTSAGAQNRTCDPYSTTTSDLDDSLYGWAIAPTDMNSVSGAERYFGAGNHVLTAQVSTNSVIGSNVDVKLTAYRVGPSPGRTRTSLGTVTEAETFPNAGGSITVTLALSEIIFAPDETIQYTLEFSSPGVVITGKTTTLHTGTSGGTATRMDTPTLKVLAQTVGSSSGSATVSGAISDVLNTVGSSSGTSTVSGVLGATSSFEGTSSGTSTVSGVLGATGSMEGSSSGTSSVAAIVTAIGSMEGSSSGSSTVDGILGAFGQMVGSSAGVGTASAVAGATSAADGTAAGLGTALGEASSLAGTVGSASGSATVSGSTSIVLGTVGTVDIGSGSSSEIIVRPIFVTGD